MLGSKLRRLGILAVPPAALSMMAASVVNAQFSQTFDTSASVTNDTSGDSGQYGLTPPPLIANSRFDFGAGGPASTNSTGWSNAEDHTGNGGGSLLDSITFKNAVSAQYGAFTMDLSGTPIVATEVSFYIMLAPGSAVNSNQGAGTSAASSGFFGVAIRDENYDFTTPGTTIVNGAAQGDNGWNFGDPTYSGTSDAGSWEFIQIPLNPADPTQNIRAITLQDYNDDNSGRKITGTVSWYVDDLTITVPEPASLGLLGFAVPALLARRRKHA